MSYDEKCYDLAHHFLADEPDFCCLLHKELAQRIQDTVEDFMVELHAYRQTHGAECHANNS